MTIFPDFVIFSSVFVVVDWVNWSIKFIERDREREKIGQKMEGAKTGFNPVSWVTRSNPVLRGLTELITSGFLTWLGGQPGRFPV